MRLRILKDIAAHKAGEIVDVPDDTAKSWVAQGEAMQDKSVEPKETKTREQEYLKKKVREMDRL